jgi:multidrug efflux pump subunit AcrA (membrane-fusion protein)
MSPPAWTRSSRPPPWRVPAAARPDREDYVTRHALLVLAVSCALPAACARSAAPPPPASDTTVAVRVARASSGDVATHFESGGVVRARLTATLASRIAGPIETVRVSAGTRVRRGETLLTIECRELDANAGGARASLAAAADAVQAADADIRAADSALTLATATQDRVRRLYEQRSATAQERDQAAAALQDAEASVAGARARAAAARSARDAADAALRASETSLSYATIAAPFDGVVAERLVDPGTLASAGMPLLVVEDPAELRLHVAIDEFRARAVTIGQLAETTVGQDARWRPARVDEIGRVDPASHSFLVKLDLPAMEGLRPGLFGRARFTSGSRRGLTIPLSSLIRRGQLTYVFTVTDDGVVRLRAVVAAEAAGDRVEVVAGLADGETVVVSPPVTLIDGAHVTRQR